MTPKTKITASSMPEPKAPKEFPDIVNMTAEALCEKIRNGLELFYRQGLYSEWLACLGRARGLLMQQETSAPIIAEHAKLIEAVCKLYYAAHWTPDRPVDSEALWTAVRDAAGFEPGNSPEPQMVMIAVPFEHADAIRATLAYLTGGA